MKDGLSIPHIGIAIQEQLARMDSASGEEYLAGVAQIIAPLQQCLGASRDEMSVLVADAGRAENTDALRRTNDNAVRVASELFAATRSVPMVQEICTTVRDAIAERALELSRRKLYFSGTYCDLPLALLAVGSDGRREQTLVTDQDYLFLHDLGSPDSELSEEEMADYFGMLGSLFASKMAEAGISRCSGGIMPVNSDWRGSLPQWQQRLTTMFLFERSDWEKNIVNLIALMDTRFVCGDKGLGYYFGKMVRARARNNPQAMKQMGRIVSAMKLSKGFLGRFVIEAEGLHKGSFNIKLLAWMPLVMSIRLLAVSVGIEETSTLGRIKRLWNDGHVTDKMATELAAAYHIITGHRISQQIKRLKRIIDDDSYINPYELSGNEREELKAAIGSIDELQSMLRGRFSMLTSVDHFLPASQ
ncbi:MAG TPA: nucleotidyltransferase [Desulfuromonadales bacterium]|nr:nucleotidyltransferase [Desulfuromonadales bacterium]